MDIRKIKKLIELLEESGIAEIEIKEGEEAVRISRMPVAAQAPQVTHLMPAAATAAEPAVASVSVPERLQFERLGYFCVDPDSSGAGLIFNRTVSLRDTWAKIEQRG